jgi:hypothetical protein
VAETEVSMFCLIAVAMSCRIVSIYCYVRVLKGIRIKDWALPRMDGSQYREIKMEG